MVDYLALSTVLFVAMITPGPNNFAILQIATRFGIRRVAAPVLGIVLGGLVMLGASLAGVSAWVASTPTIGPWIAGLGSAYLLWLAYGLVVPRDTATKNGKDNPRRSMLMSATGLFMFQFLNPKAWMLMLTVAAIVPWKRLTSVDILLIAIVFVVMPALCLLVWALLGAVASDWLSRYIASRTLDRLFGFMLALTVVFIWR